LSFKNIAFSTAAVLVAMVMSLGLMVQPARAAGLTSVIGNIANTTASLATNMQSGTNTATATTGTVVLTESAAGDLAAGKTLVLAATGWTLGTNNATSKTINGVAATGAGPTGSSNGTCTGTSTLTAATSSDTSGRLIITIGVASGAAATLTCTGFTVTPTTPTTATGPISVHANSTLISSTNLAGLNVGQVVGTATATAAPLAGFVAPYNLKLSVTGSTSTCSTAMPPTGITADGTGMFGANVADATYPADGSQGAALCATLVDALGYVVPSVPITFTSSVGVVSTGTAKTVVALTSSGGNATTNYRGAGGNTATDTIVASNSSLNVVATLSVGLTAGAGTTASKMSFSAPTALAAAPTIAGTTANYVSPQLGSRVALQVTDASGLGVNGQTVLLSVDRGVIIADPTFTLAGGGFADIPTACAAAIAAPTKSITQVSAATNVPSPGGTAASGWINATVCGYSSDAAGKISVTAQNVSTTMANATTSLAMPG